MSISISDWIQVIAIVVSLVTSAISIRLSRIAIEQSAKANELTKQAAEDMARPYVNVYVDIFAIKKHSRVLPLKILGKPLLTLSRFKLTAM